MSNMQKFVVVATQKETGKEVQRFKTKTTSFLQAMNDAKAHFKSNHPKGEEAAKEEMKGLKWAKGM